MSELLPLHDDWTLRALPHAGVPDHVGVRDIAATVPGCVHTDLLAAHLIPDPMLGSNEQLVSWVSEADWLYSSAFDSDLGSYERVDLVCEGLDTVAELTLNGALVGATANMHRSYRFDVTDTLRSSGNELSVVFRSALAYGEAMRAQLGDRPGPYPAPFAFIRKMACNFGWDWGPALVTAGIWRPVGLHGWSTARIASVRPLVTVGDDGVGRVALHVEVERTAAGLDRPLSLSMRVAGHGQSVGTAVPLAPGETTVVVDVELAGALLWWPRGYGGQPLYDASLQLTSDGAALDAWQRRVGFRTVELDTTPDAAGVPFRLIVNGAPILVRGANWIPDDVFVTRLDRASYERSLADACDAGLNLLRVWGGGMYESEDFYDVADERGLLVWQDFLFACAAYPEESPLAEEVVAEAREVVVRLAAHPSLVLWNGNNENIWGFWDWGWQEVLEGRSWGAHYYFDTLPAIVAELDPTRPYWPGSPYSGSPDVHPNEPSRGVIHIWDVWNTRDYLDYRTYAPRFVAEFGYQAPPSMATLRRALDPADLTPTSAAMLVHQKAIGGNLKLERGLDEHFGVPADVDDWHYLTQLNQARALQVGIEHFRSTFPVCTGTIVWQLNDCWPSVSWAAVDGDGHRKPLWFALRQSYRDRLLTVQPRDGGLVVSVGNDTAGDWQGGLEVVRLSFSGAVLASFATTVSVSARDAVTVAVPDDVAAADDVKGELVVARFGDQQAHWFFERDRNLNYPAAEYAVVTTPVVGGTAVTITAVTLLRDVCLFPDRLDPTATVDTALVTLLPGESATFTVQHGAHVVADELGRAPVLRCVNDILGS
ncbi:glycoside hydrolase family 2 protein [Acidothermaceae bacterium B102]|nr:glycoside hydrolase family 2 protein [Acidothermaceae bacterium B102]